MQHQFLISLQWTTRGRFAVHAEQKDEFSVFVFSSKTFQLTIRQRWRQRWKDESVSLDILLMAPEPGLWDWTYVRYIKKTAGFMARDGRAVRGRDRAGWAVSTAKVSLLSPQSATKHLHRQHSVARSNRHFSFYKTKWKTKVDLNFITGVLLLEKLPSKPDTSSAP